MIKPNLVWPGGILIPPKPPVLVYLDQLYWINMAKSDGNADPILDSYRAMLSKCRHLIKSGSTRFVLSNVHYLELQRIRNPKQRADVARLMKELTAYSTIQSRAVVTALELDALVARKCGQDPKRGAVPLIGKGLFHAVGRPMTLRVIDKVTGEDRTEETRSLSGESKFDAFMKFANTYTEDKFLFGPQDDEIEMLRGFGYAPEKMEGVYESRRQREMYLADILRKNANLRKGDRLLRVVSANELVHELHDELIAILEDYGTTLAFLLGSTPEEALGFTSSMPTIDVVVALRAHYHSQIHKKWETNDVHDIDAMSVAVAYCDVVWTDNEVVDALSRQNLSFRMDTKIGSTPQRFVDLAV